MSGRMRRGGINGLAPGKQHLGSPGVATRPPRSSPRGPPPRHSPPAAHADAPVPRGAGSGPLPPPPHPAALPRPLPQHHHSGSASRPTPARWRNVVGDGGGTRCSLGTFSRSPLPGRAARAGTPGTRSAAAWSGDKFLHVEL